MENKIPKIIHYAWFGRGEKPDLVRKCIASWKRYLPEYEFIEWNEDNFDLDKYPYAREAYSNRKFAYVSDVVRLHALYECGGIYMDTDVEVLKPLDRFLTHDGFSGFQSLNEIPTGIMASKKKNKWVNDQLDYYRNNHFDLDSVNKKHITNVELITSISLEKHGLILNNEYQVLKYGMAMYPMDYFCAKWADSGKIYKTKNTVTIHHFAGSWTPKSARRHKRIYRFICKIIGEKNAKRLLKLIKGNK